MGEVPKELGKVCAPFSHCNVDLFGPMVVKGIGGYGRKTFKTWGVMFSCVSSRAVSIWLSTSYSSKDFMECFRKQAAIYGVPLSLRSDRGSQLVSAATDLKEWSEFVRERRENRSWFGFIL